MKYLESRTQVGAEHEQGRLGFGLNLCTPTGIRFKWDNSEVLQTW